MFPANSEWGLVAVLPEGAMSVTCEGLIYSLRIESPLELASSESLFICGPALLCPWPSYSSLACVVHSRPVPCVLFVALHAGMVFSVETS